MFMAIDQTTMHIYGGASAHVFKDITWFWKYVPIKAKIEQVTGDKVDVVGI